jgi:hypothetical protein
MNFKKYNYKGDIYIYMSKYELLNLNIMKKMLIKLDKCEYEEKKQYRELIKKYIKESIENSCDNFLVGDIKIHRNGGYGFTVYSNDDKEYIKIIYIAHNNSCEICYNGKFKINLKY